MPTLQIVQHPLRDNDQERESPARLQPMRGVPRLESMVVELVV